jgi:hypothetical protein
MYCRGSLVKVEGDCRMIKKRKKLRLLEIERFLMDFSDS